MGFVDDDEIVSVPAQTGEVGAVGIAALSAKIGMVEDFVIESIRGQWVVDVIVAIGVPVVGEFFGTEDEDIFVARFIILHDGQGGECFAEADRIGEDAAIVLFEIIDDGEGCVALEMIEHVPDFAFFKAGALVGQRVLRYILQKLMEDVVKRGEIDELWRVFVIDCGNTFDELIGDILKARLIVPMRFELIELLLV